MDGIRLAPIQADIRGTSDGKTRLGNTNKLSPFSYDRKFTIPILSYGVRPRPGTPWSIGGTLLLNTTTVDDFGHPTIFVENTTEAYFTTVGMDTISRLNTTYSSSLPTNFSSTVVAFSDDISSAALEFDDGIVALHGTVENVALGTRIGVVANVLGHPIATVYCGEEQLSRGVIFESPSPAAAIYRFHLAANFTGVMNVTHATALYDIQTEVPPAEPLNTQTVDLVAVRTKAEFRFGDTARLEEANVTTSTGQTFPFVDVIPDPVTDGFYANVSIVLPDNTSMLSVYGDLTNTGDLAVQEVGKLPWSVVWGDKKHFVGGNGLIFQTSLNPAQKFSLVMLEQTPRLSRLEVSSFWVAKSEEADLTTTTSTAVNASLTTDTAFGVATDSTQSTAVTDDLLAARGRSTAKPGAIAGAVVGSLVGLAFIVLLVVCVKRRKRSRTPELSRSTSDSGLDVDTTVTPYSDTLQLGASGSSKPPRAFHKAAHPVVRDNSEAAPVRTPRIVDGDLIAALKASIGSSRRSLPLVPRPPPASLPHSDSIMIERDAGLLQPMTVLPPNYDPQWAQDRRTREREGWEDAASNSTDTHVPISIVPHTTTNPPGEWSRPLNQ